MSIKFSELSNVNGKCVTPFDEVFRDGGGKLRKDMEYAVVFGEWLKLAVHEGRINIKLSDSVIIEMVYTDDGSDSDDEAAIKEYNKAAETIADYLAVACVSESDKEKSDYMCALADDFAKNPNTVERIVELSQTITEEV